MNIGEAIEALNRMEAEMREINAMLKPMARRDPANRGEPAWNAYSISGAHVKSIERLRGWIQAAVREIT